MFGMHTGVLDWAGTEEAGLQSILDEEDNVKTRIIFAREELKVCSLLSLGLLVHTHTHVLRRRGKSNAVFFLCASILCANICRRQQPSVPFHLSLCPFPRACRDCNYLPIRSSTCARRLVVRKPKDSARKSSRAKWQELPLVSSLKKFRVVIREAV